MKKRMIEIEGEIEEKDKLLRYSRYYIKHYCIYRLIPIFYSSDKENIPSDEENVKNEVENDRETGGEI